MPQVESSIHEQVKKFKRAVINSSSSLVTPQDRAVVNDIPNTVFERIFVRVFSGDEKLARDILFGRFNNVDFSTPQQVIDSINTLPLAAEVFALSMASNSPMLLISDVDNDGALAQAIMMQTKRITGADISVQPRDYNPSEHGFTNEQIANWLSSKGLSQDAEFTVFVADLGTNQRHRQQEFLTRFPNASLVIADHHTPELELKVDENVEGRCLLVSPFNKGSLDLGVRKGGGVSGSYLLSRVLQSGLRQCLKAGTIDIGDKSIDFLLEPLERMGVAANLLDGVDSDIRLKPLRPTDIDQLNSLSSDVRPGRALPSLLQQNVESDIDALVSLVGDVGVNELHELQREAVSLNHYACALHSVLGNIVSAEYKGNVADDVVVAMNTIPIEQSRQHNYFQYIRPYYYHFGYDNLVSEGAKRSWSDLTKYTFRQVSKLEKAMLAFIRDYELVEEISHDHVLMTRPAAAGIKNVFTPRQMNTAYHSQGKTINLEMRRVEPGKAVLGIKSDVGVYDVLKNVRQSMPDVDMRVEGHQNVGALTLTYPRNQNADTIIRQFAARLNEETAVVLANKPVMDGIEVSPLHLSLIHELMTNMCLHIDSSAAPELIMRINPNTTFEDKRSLKMQTVEELVEQREWETTVEPLTFSMDLSLILPNQALKGVANEGYEGALGIKMLSNGAFMADKVYLADQLKHIPLTALRTPDDSMRQQMYDDYERYFKDRDMPIMPLSEEAGAAAIKFVSDGMSAHRNTKKMIAATLVKTGRDSYVSMDLEANGGANAEAYNVGMSILTIDGERRPVISESELRERLDKGDVPSILEKTEDGRYVVEPKLRSMMLSLIINMDGDRPIRISLRSQALTNMDQNLVESLGCSAEDAQDFMLNVLNECGSCIFQGHNFIAYDSAVTRVNFPKVYEFIKDSIQLDTKPLANDTHLAYFNLLTANVDGVAFANTPGSRSALSELLASGEDFTIPSVKGTHVLKVSGGSVTMQNLSTRMESPLKRGDTTSQELLSQVKNMAAPLPLPKHNIALLMRMESIHEMLSMRANANRQIVPFETIPGMPEFDTDLWSHFQERFSFDRTLNENIDGFLVLEQVQNALAGDPIEISVANKENYSESVQRLIEQKMSVGKKDAIPDSVTISPHDLLRASAFSFARENSEQIELFSNAWVYERVLQHYEPTNKRDLTEGTLRGVSERTGVPVELVRQVYGDTFTYRDARGVKSYCAIETHNNVGPEGDTWQESHVVMDLTVKRMVNPFVTDEMILAQGVTPLQKAVDTLHHYTATSTLKHIKSYVVDLMMDTDVINSYGARQLDNYSDLGISISNSRDGVASMRCKSISKSDSRVDIDFPQIDASEWRAMDQATRDEMENKVEMAVSLLLLVNSIDPEKTPANVYSALNKIAHDQDMVDTIKWVAETFGEAIPNDRKQSASDWLNEMTKAMVSGKMKVKMNKHMNDKDLDVITNAFVEAFDVLDSMNHPSAITRDAFIDAVTTARFQYHAFELVRKNGEAPNDVPGFGDVKGPLKGQLTRLVNAMSAVSEEHSKVNPSLVKGVVTKKTDASKFVLSSPLITEHLKNSLKLDAAPQMAREALLTLKR